MIISQKEIVSLQESTTLLTLQQLGECEKVMEG